MPEGNDENLSIWRQPGRTLYYFCVFAWRGTTRSLREALSHPVFICIVMPSLAAYLAAKRAVCWPEMIRELEVRIPVSLATQPMSIHVHHAATHTNVF